MSKDNIKWIDYEPINSAMKEAIGLDFTNPETVTKEAVDMYAKLSYEFLSNLPDNIGLKVKSNL